MLHYNQITDLIAELLFKHDCVIVPNFGGFVARNYSSNFSKGSNVLYPQTKQVLFNKNLTHNDGLLISALMQKNNMTIAEATKQTEDYKDYIQSLLSAKKRFELHNVGLLYIDTENTLRFEAKTDVNFLLESFGFEPVIANELAVEIEKPAVVKPFEDRRVVAEAVLPKKRSYAKIATLAVGLPVTLAFLLFAAYSKPMKPLLQSSFNPFYTPEKTYTPNKSNNNKAVIINDVQKASLLVDANGYATFKLSENGNVLVASVDSIAKTDKTTVVKPVYTHSNDHTTYDGKYQVVVGCFGVEENANKLIKELHSKHISAGISGVNSKGLHVVSCGGFNTKEDAANLLTSVRVQFPNAWVMSK
ncbi:MAG: SPOR domain-containing protein [Bacteroidetes bacterium]|nr:SPOR domain-containing protein [Bacteroidota bacterium]